MTKSRIFLCVAWLAGSLFATTAPVSSAAADPLADEAMEILRAEIGTWTSRWDNLNAAGEVVRSVEGIETFSIFNGERVLLLETHIASAGRTNKAFRFYSPELKKLMIIDVQEDGRHYVLHQDVGEPVIQSEPVTGRNGRTSILRFTTIEETAGKKTVNHEISHDDGATWRLFRRQYMEKISMSAE